MSKMSPLGEKLEEVKGRIAAACERAKRPASEVTLVAVTKHAPPEAIREIVALGVSDLGESRVQQLVQRAAALSEFLARRSRGETGAEPKRVRWHMIGHLQRNKAKPLLPVVGMIQSIDSLRLGEELDLHGIKGERRTPVLMQVNASEEPQKYGVAVGAAVHLGEQLATMPNIQLVGLMTMAADGASEQALRQTFARTREVFDEMKWQKIGGAGFRHLSMGMSNDYELAIEEGSTMVRIGSSLFGSHPDSAQEEPA